MIVYHDLKEILKKRKLQKPNTVMVCIKWWVDAGERNSIAVAVAHEWGPVSGRWWIMENIHMSLSRDFEFNLIDLWLCCCFLFIFKCTHPQGETVHVILGTRALLLHIYMDDGQIFIVSLERTPISSSSQPSFGLLL